jgi:hypothetical protein
MILDQLPPAKIKIDHVWHFYGPSKVPPQFSYPPFDLYTSDLLALMMIFDVQLYRDKSDKIVLALDKRGERFRARNA